MMKKMKVVGIGSMVFFILFSTFYFTNRFSFAKVQPYYSVPLKNDSLLTIGIIGDSWVADKQLDSILQIHLLYNGHNSKIFSSGQPGAKSKLIYQNLFKEENNIYSSKFIIENNPKYCIVIAGVNDAISQMGGHFYAYHMTQIIKTLVYYKIIPIIVSCPEFGIIETLNNLDVMSKTRNIVSANFNNNGELNNIKTYRKILTEELESENLKDNVIVVDFDNVSREYAINSNLYTNSSHLSIKGNQKLCEIITNELLEIMNNP